ncbi:MAG: NADPH:quinone reductase, partial [Nitrospinaceae bacterium]|nr:NADPH:quinone reductase [Nitrospinaceae bacterium]
PEAGEGEVRVRLSASGVNPSDSKARLGSRPVKWPFIVPHSDGAGVIDQVGPGVNPARVGERVWVYNGQWERQLGTAAEYIALPAETAVRLPDSVSFAEGACLGIPAMTAHRCLLADGPVDGFWVLVTGGAGAVGNYGIQLAKWAGANVISTVSSEAKAEAAKRAGADHVLNYKSEDIAERVLEITDGKGVDRIVEVDLGENFPVSAQVIKGNGSIGTYASSRVPEPVFPHYKLMPRNVNVRLVFVYEMPDEAKRSACADITRAIEEGGLGHPVGPSFSLDDVAAAHEVIEGGDFIGNVVLEID